MKDLIRIEHEGKRYYTNSKEAFDSGNFYLSVTNILSCAVAEKLQTYMKKNTAAAQEKKLVETADIGSKIHSLIEKDLKGEEVNKDDLVVVLGKDDNVYDLSAPFEQWSILKAKHDIEAKHTEQLVYHSSGFAGTADIIGTFEGKPCLMDIKTGWYSIKTGWQLAAYCKAWEEMTGEDLGMCGLSIKRDGSVGVPYIYEHKGFCETAFLATYTTYKALYFTSLNKMKFRHLLTPTTITIG